ncbi:MAG: UTP--glucose-1-phosphate uridylyltransferase GalU [Candidatus Marinimicrobia bacterium]|nr:UTP--glucose-1-phosphate uridylyltransferase GalU [Candidatus Neomarinimicrobiota bacterium]MDD5061927.1 UTP--glucose-1-phosphate uridylyltransferase GalU [Candidatus Neomarinimicrobiota bacterium]MDD5230666.1 UTP--glucose-1-phosphate uridylyltransferase GalU [Candidatus Neomarinimicrobiota bacterium]
MIKKAVIPAAGLGTRFLPATKAQPKEMLPIIDTPTIQYVVQEAIDSGIEDILIISGKGKRAIEDHFDRNTELEYILEQKGEHDLATSISRIGEMANIHFIRQKQLNGLGDAIYYAKQHTGDEPFVVMLGDTINDAIIPVTQQLIDIYNQYRQTVIAVERVPRDKIDMYGIVSGNEVSERVYKVNQLIEKPRPAQTKSDLAVAGRYILTPAIYPMLEKVKPGKNKEIQLTDALQLLLQRESIFAYIFEGRRFDVGNKLDYLRTTVEMALKREEFSSQFLDFLKSVVAQAEKK